MGKFKSKFRKFQKLGDSGFRYKHHAEYFVLLDRSAGRRNVYTVLLVTSDDPIVIGRELPLLIAKVQVALYEERFEAFPYYGSRKQALAARRKVNASRVTSSR